MSKEDLVFGEVDWNSGDLGSGGGGNEFMRLEVGDNTVRIMGNPTQAYVHWVENSEGKKRKFNSPIGDPALVRKLEESEFKKKPIWFLKVLDRRDEKFKLLEIGPQIYRGIKALHENKKWGNVTRYDITIIKGKPGTNPLYNVSPDPAEPLDPSFKEKFIEFNEKVNLDKLIKPSEPEVIREFLGWNATASSRTSSSSSSKGKQSGGDDGDFDFNFDE